MFPNQDPNQPPQPNLPPPGQVPQQASSGQYAVVPPPMPGQNNGHSGHNPYEFIVAPNTPKRSLNLFGGNAFLQKIAFLVGGAIVVIIIITLVVSAAFPSSNNKDALTKIAQQQQELARVAALGDSEATGTLAKGFAINTELSIQTSQQQIIAYLGKYNIKLSAGTLMKTRNLQTDKLFQDAQSASNFDSTMVSTLTKQLQAYEASLALTFKNTKSTAVRSLLNQNYQAAVMLLKQGATVTD